MRYKLILSVVLLGGLFLRIYDLGSESLWYDEAYSMQVATHLDFSHIAAEDKHPPLYYIMLHYWIAGFGRSEFSMRFLSVIFGFFTLGMVYKVGSSLFDKEAGILSALIVGLSKFHVFHSQDARMYSLMALLTLLSMYFFIKLFEKKSFMVSIGYILSSIFLIYTHYYGLFIITGQNIYFFTLVVLSEKEHKPSLKRWALMQAIVIVLFIPWIGILISQALKVKSSYWLQEPSIRTIGATFYKYSGSSVPLTLFFLIMSALSIITYEKIKGRINWRDFFASIENHCWNIRLPDVQKPYLLFVWLFCPIILPFIISKLFAPIYLYKYTIGASLAFYLFVVRGIRNIQNTHFQVILISIVVVLSGANLWGYYTEVTKDQWRNVAGYVDTRAEKDDLLLFYEGYGQIVFDYYSTREDLIKKPFLKDSTEEDIKQIIPTVGGHKRVWVIFSHIFNPRNKNLIINMLHDNYNLSNQEKYTGIKIYLFEKNEYRDVG